MKNILCFDMDGTIADLYNVQGWLNKLRSEDPSPYEDACPMWNMKKLNEAIERVKKAGWEIRVITWLSKNSSKEYKNAVREAKKAWLRKWGFEADHFHGIAYGTTKANCVRKAVGKGTAILFDDNEKIRKGWNLGKTVNPQEVDLIEYLNSLI